jgi:predicted  nucleic acid-binding Zn-ribbon protein
MVAEYNIQTKCPKCKNVFEDNVLESVQECPHCNFNLYQEVKAPPQTTISRSESNIEGIVKRWAVLCPECRQACDEYWNEMWREYHSERL